MLQRFNSVFDVSFVDPKMDTVVSLTQFNNKTVTMPNNT